MFYVRLIIATFVVSVGIVSCGTSEKSFSCMFPSSEKLATRADPLNITIRIDGSDSMLGYVSNPDSRYVQLIKLLDETLSLSSKNPVRYYRSISEINRSDFRKALLPEFYQNSLTFKSVSAPIQEMLSDPGNQNSLQVVVTDLDQASGDVTLLVQKIKNTLLNSKHPDYAVAIWAVKSEFTGTVYVSNEQGIDTFSFPNSESSDKKRPFYVIFVGSVNDVITSLKSLKDRGAILFNDSKISIFSPNILTETISYLSRNIRQKPQEKKIVFGQWNLSKNNFKVQATDSNSQLWRIPPNSREPIEVQDSVEISPLEDSVLMSVDTIGLVKKIDIPNKFSNKFEDSKAVLKDDSSLQKAIDISNWKLDTANEPNKLNFSTMIYPDKFPNPGVYLFTIDLVVRDLQDQPSWNDWNWQIGRDAMHDGSKTKNLLSFLRGLKSITADLIKENSPKIGRFCYGIQKD